MPPKKKGDARGGGPKPGTKQAKTAAEQAASSSKAPPPPTEEPKKPSVKEVIGGASWTGKLPVNMLAEHCQKQKWEKPEYTMVCGSMACLSTPCGRSLEACTDRETSFRCRTNREKDMYHRLP